MDKKEYDAGYQAAIDAIKKALSNNGKNNGNSGNSGQGDPDLNTNINPANNNGPMSKNAQQQQAGQLGNGAGGDGSMTVQQPGGGSGSGSDGQSGQGDSAGTPGGDRSSSESRKARQGEVSKLGGTFFDPKIGEQIAKDAGYSPSDAGGSASIADIEQKWNKIGKQVQSALRERGTGIGNGLCAALDDLYRANFNWKQELRKIVGHAVSKTDFDDKWGKKRDLALYGEIRRFDVPTENNMSTCVFAIDTSQSNLDNLGILISETLQICRQKGLNVVTYAPYDYDLQAVFPVATRKPSDVKELLKELPGGGGTSIERALDTLEKGWKTGKLDIYGKEVKIRRSGGRCQCLIVFTDGEDTFPNLAKKKPSWIRNLIFVVANNNKPKAIQQLIDAGYKVLYIDKNDIK